MPLPPGRQRSRLRGAGPAAAALCAAAAAAPRVSYRSSAWEQEWLDNIDSWQTDGDWKANGSRCLATACRGGMAYQAETPDEPGVWQRGCAAMRRRLSDGSLRKLASGVRGYATDSGMEGISNEQIFSSLTVESEGSVTTSWLEPLVGSLRDPRATCTGLGARHGNSRNWLLLGGGAQQHQKGRSWLFDLGASTWNDGLGGSSQEWLVRAFRAVGVDFAGIRAWDAEERPARRLWASYPAWIKPRVAYYNIPVSPVPGSGDHPWDHVVQLCTPADYVVVKVDIDSPGLEQTLVEQLLRNTTLHALVDEFIFEHHVRYSPMVYYWGRHGPLEQTAAQSYRLFLALRRLGIRAHSWV